MSNPPRGTFATDCHECGRELTVTNGRPDEHHCHYQIRLADIQAALTQGEQ